MRKGEDRTPGVPGIPGISGISGVCFEIIFSPAVGLSLLGRDLETDYQFILENSFFISDVLCISSRSFYIIMGIYFAIFSSYSTFKQIIFKL